MHYQKQFLEDIKKIIAHNFSLERNKLRISQSETQNAELNNHIGNALTVIEMQVKQDVKNYINGTEIETIVPDEKIIDE